MGEVVKDPDTGEIRYRKQHYPEKAREKIRASAALKRLVGHVEGDVELSSTQVTAALALLKKVLPDAPALSKELDADEAKEWSLKL